MHSFATTLRLKITFSAPLAMKTFLTGIVALALVVLPMVVYTILIRAHSDTLKNATSLSTVVIPFLLSWLAGFITAICGLRIKKDGPDPLHFLGKFLCGAAIMIQIFCTFSFMASCRRGLSNLT